MATRTVHVSDISGEPEAVTATIGVDGVWHEVDLTETEKDELQQIIAPYVSAGRRIGPTLSQKKKLVPDTTVEERDEIRAWARDNGYELAEYGRIPKKIFAAYNNAHSDA